MLVNLDLDECAEQELRGSLTSEHSIHLRLNGVGYNPVSLSCVNDITMTNIIFTLSKGHQGWGNLGPANPSLEGVGGGQESFDEWDLYIKKA